MRLLHLPEEAVRGHTEEEILDLERYFKPDLTISSGFTGAKKRVLEDKGNSDILHIEEVDKYWIKETESETILILRDSDSVDHLSRDSFIGENTSVITDMIREEVGRISYERSLKKVSIIDELSDIFDDFHTFSTGVEAERQHHYNGKKIHGLGPVIDREGVKIPFLKTGETPKVKSFPAERVGLLAIPGLGKKFSTKLKSRGIVDRKKLKEKNPEEIMDLEGVGPHRGTKWISSAEAIENECVYTIQENELEDKHKIYLDIETDSLDPSIVWHIGLYDDKEEEYTCLMEKEPEKKGRIMKRFGEYLEEHCGPDSVLLAWYGSGFDFKVLENFFERYHRKYLDRWKAIKKVDLMEWVKNHAVTTCRTSKLEDVAERLGFERKTPDLTGKEVGDTYAAYMNGKGGEPDWEKLKTYGRDDVISLKHIYEEVKEAPKKYDMKKMKKKYRELKR